MGFFRRRVDEIRGDQIRPRDGFYHAHHSRVVETFYIDTNADVVTSGGRTFQPTSSCAVPAAALGVTVGPRPFARTTEFGLTSATRTRARHRIS